MITFNDFLKFERDIYRDEYPVASYDAALIRYGEYQFALESIAFQRSMTVLDLGCEHNIFMLFLALQGCHIIGVDINPKVKSVIDQHTRRVENTTGQKLDIQFRADDATRLSVASNSVDAVIAISSIEHMFSNHGHGDQLAVASIARVLRPGGFAVVTVPMSNGAPFHEAPRGDARFRGPYRLYTPDTLRARFLINAQLETVSLKYLANSTPDVRYSQMHFHLFWLQTLVAQERAKWHWAQPILASIFNPIVTAEEGEARLETLNTALICYRKKNSVAQAEPVLIPAAFG